MDVAGKVYQEDDLLPGAEVNLDFGTVKAVSGKMAAICWKAWRMAAIMWKS